MWTRAECARTRTTEAMSPQVWRIPKKEADFTAMWTPLSTLIVSKESFRSDKNSLNSRFHFCILIIALASLTMGACRPYASLKPAGAEAPVPTPAELTLHPQETTPAPQPTANTPALDTPTSLPSPTISTSSPTATEVPTTTLAFTGVIVPARCVQASLDEKGDSDYPYEEVRSIIHDADLAVGVFNATMSDRVEHTGCVWTYQLVGSPDNADAMQRAGFDLMSVATNHIKDCGLMKSWCNETFFDTLDNLRRVGIPHVGAGKDLQEALQPAVLEVNGVRFGFVALGDSKMDERVFAAEDNPGIAHLDETNLRTAIAAARKISDVVITLPHWGSEDNFVPNWIQRVQAQQLATAGADLVVGNHTHVVQAIQTVDSTPVFYGLGNFVFDQGLRDHRQGVILLVYFKGNQYSGYKLIPTHVDRDGRVHIAGQEEAAEILQSIELSSDLMD